MRRDRPAASRSVNRPMGRAQRAAIAAGAALVVYVAAIIVGPLRRFDDTTKFFQHAHRADDRLHAHGVPSLRSWATALVILCVIGLACTLCRRMTMLVRVRAIAIPALSLAIAEIGKVLLPRPARAWEPAYLSASSFPSGHVALAGGCILAGLLVLPAWRWVVPTATAALTIVIAIVVAAAQHRVLDTVGGALVALAAAALVGPVKTVTPDADFLRRIGSAAVGAVVLAVVGAAVAPSDLRTASRSSVNVAFGIGVLLAAATAAIVVALSAESASSRTGSSRGTSAPSPSTAARG